MMGIKSIFLITTLVLSPAPGLAPGRRHEGPPDLVVLEDGVSDGGGEVLGLHRGEGDELAQARGVLAVPLTLIVLKQSWDKMYGTCSALSFTGHYINL